VEDWLGISIGLGCIAAGSTAMILAYRQRAGVAVAPAAAQPAAPGASTVRPANQLPILSGAELVQRTGTQGLLEEVRTRMGLAPQNWDRDVVPLVHRFAEFVQLLPASESHHHAQPGGLLIHAMECAAGAAALRHGYKLPLNAAPEEQIRLGSVWGYGVLVAALLHDVGKPVADVVISLYGAQPAQALGHWNGLAGSMLAARTMVQASHYTVEFPAVRDYGAHARLPASLLHALVPEAGLQWLATDPTLMRELLGYLDGSDNGKPGALREIVTKADMRSVADNLMKGSRTRFASARSLPLIERLMSGLRALLAEGHVAFNRPGAPAFVVPDGQHLWMVAGAAADQTRKLLEQREERLAGAAGIPADNTRLFDTWAEYGALVQPPRTFGKGSVWWARIEIDGWQQVLTVLKFPMDTVFPAGAARPSPLKGAVVPVEPSSRQERDEAAPGADRPAGGEPPAAAEPHAVVQAVPPAGDWRSLIAQPQALPTRSEAAAGRTDTGPPIAGSAPSSHVLAAPEFLDSQETAGAVRSTPTLAAPGKPVQALGKAPRPLYRLPNATARPNADQFMAWVQRGLGTGDLNYNEADAVVHFVDEGMALVSPRVFRMYLETNEFIGDVGSSKDALRALQQEVQKGGYIARNKVDKGSFHYFHVQRENEAPGAVITCYVIPNPQAYIRPVPAFNPLLKACAKPEKPAAAS